MTNYDLSILIPARNEEFLSRTVENILENKRGATEILIGLDGQWADPPVSSHPDVTIVYYGESIGQRAMTNQLCRLSKAKYVMKIDAHCKVDEGFDVKMIEAFESLPDGDSVTMIPALYNLHVFNWKCKKCGRIIYQGKYPEYCMMGGEDRKRNLDCDSTNFEREIIWDIRKTRRSEFYRFDLDLHFQYHRARKDHPESLGDLVETMSAQGSCFMLTREKYWELDICDEAHGSWGQQGTEVACKTWLSGGRLLTNKNTWYSHLFRTQEGFGFPYPQDGSQIDNARKYSKKLFLENTWSKQILPLSWLIEKFKPMEDWHGDKGREILALVNKRGEEFYKKHPEIMVIDRVDIILPEDTKTVIRSSFKIDPKYLEPTKGIIYYTDNQLNLNIAHACRKQIQKSGLPIVSTSLKPTKFGKNIHMKGFVRGWEAYFKQILKALETLDTDIVYFCEHDWLYHPSHFDFTPERDDTFYYNWNWWRVRSSDGHAVHYNTQLVPGIVCYRKLAVEYYRQVVEYLEKEGFTSETAHNVGFEPGTHKRVPFSGNYKVERFDSEFPIIDIRHTNNLTSSKWSQDAFRNPKNAQGWVESKAWELPGWEFSKKEPFDVSEVNSL